MRAIHGTTVQTGYYCIPAMGGNGVAFESEGTYELSDAIGDLNSAKFNLDMGHIANAEIRLEAVTNYLAGKGVSLNHNNNIPEELRPTFLKYQSLMTQYASLKK